MKKVYKTKIEFIPRYWIKSNKKIGDIKGGINCILQSTISRNIILLLVMKNFIYFHLQI